MPATTRPDNPSSQGRETLPWLPPHSPRRDKSLTVAERKALLANVHNALTPHQKCAAVVVKGLSDIRREDFGPLEPRTRARTTFNSVFRALGSDPEMYVLVFALLDLIEPDTSMNYVDAFFEKGMSNEQDSAVLQHVASEVLEIIKLELTRSMLNEAGLEGAIVDLHRVEADDPTPPGYLRVVLRETEDSFKVELSDPNGQLNE